MAMTYEQIHEMVNKEGFSQSPVEQFKMTFKYDPQYGWNQVTNNLDIFKDFEHVQNVCGDNPICLLDSVNYSVMHQNDVTDFMYRFVTWLPNEVKDRIVDNHEMVLDFIYQGVIQLLMLGGMY